MLKHGRAGVPMEVMGLMLGEFVDDYTVRVIDVFAMPQSGTVSRYVSHSVVLPISSLKYCLTVLMIEVHFAGLFHINFVLNLYLTMMIIT